MIRTILFHILLMITFSVAGSAFAAVIDLGSASGLPGTKVTLPVTLTNDQEGNIESIAIDILYDTTKLEFPSATLGPQGSLAGKTVTSSTPATGLFRVGVFGLDEMTLTKTIGNGVFANVTFTIKSTTVAGVIPLPTLTSAADAQDNLLTTSGTQGSITVLSSVIPGDCDADGSITIAEVQSAINMYLGLKTTAACVDGDVNTSVSIAEVQKVINGYLGL